MKAGEVVATRYRLDAKLGAGGMGEVWRASHLGTGRPYAIKFLHAHAANSESARARFGREARASARIGHPNVIDILDVGELDEGVLYLAMELLDGITLGDALHLKPGLSVQDLLSVMLDTARALAAAHAVGIVHRDVKPANIFLHIDRATGFAAAKILDFGISKFGGAEDSSSTATGAVLGSPRYMSPEQARASSSVDHRTDLWACGVILFEGLTGTWPHDGETFTNLVVSICTQPPRSIDREAPWLPEPIRALVRECLEPAEKRIQSAAEVVARLERLVQDPTLATMALPRPRHPPSDAIRSTTGVRVRPPQLATTGDQLRVTHSQVAPIPTFHQPPPLAALAQVPMPVLPQGGPPDEPAPLFRGRANTEQMPPGAPPIPRPPDPLVGTASHMSFATGASAPPMQAAPVAPPPAPFVPPAAPRRSGSGLRLAAAALSVLLVGIVIALVTVLRSGPADPVAAAGVEPSAPAVPAEPVPSATAAKPVESAPAILPPASASAAEPAAPVTAEPRATSAPRAPATPRKRPKIDQLGSGL